MSDTSRAAENGLVKVRITGDFIRTQREDFTFYFDVPAPPPPNSEPEVIDEWCSLVNDEITKKKPADWAIHDWNAEYADGGVIEW
jgi:hypothetical protein